MGLFYSLKQYMEDFKLWLYQNKLKFIALVLIVVVAFVFGIVMFVNNDGWWQQNRCKHINLLLYGNFFTLFFDAIFQLCLLLLVLFLSCLHKHLQLIKYFALFVGGIYVGANVAGLFVAIGICATIYAVFYVLFSLIILLILCLDNVYPTEYCKRIVEVFVDCKKQILLICSLSLMRFLLLFLILRPFSGVF